MILKAHLRPLLEPLDKLDYNISEAQYADFQVNDPFAKAWCLGFYRGFWLVGGGGLGLEVLEVLYVGFSLVWDEVGLEG